MTDRHIILGIVASAIASKRADSPYRSSTQINYSEHIADRVIEVLEAKGFEIVEKAKQEPARHWLTWADAGYRSALTPSQLDALAPFKAVQS